MAYAMKLTEGQKTAIASGTLTYWRELLIFLALVAVAFLGWRWQSAAGEVDALKSRLNLQSSIAEQEKKLVEIEARERELYPAIESKLKELADAEAALTAKRAELQKVTRQTIQRRVEKLDTNQIAEAFEAKGYPATVIKGAK